MADSPTWMELREMFLSLKSIDQVRLDWSLNTPTKAGLEAGNLEFETWRVAQGSKQDRREFEAVSSLAGKKLLSILNSPPSNPLHFVPSDLKEFWFGMACQPPKGMASYRVCSGLRGDIRLESIESATLFHAPSHFATECLQFLGMFGEGPSLCSPPLVTFETPMAEQPTGDSTTWEALGGERIEDWGELSVAFDATKPSELNFEARSSSIAVSFSQLGLTKKNTTDEIRSVVGDYLKTVIEHSSSLGKNGNRGAVKATRERLNRILRQFFGLSSHAIDPMNRPLFNPRNMKFVRPVRRVG